jgi:hypothetical protein
MNDSLETFDRRVASIMRDRLKLPSPMSQSVRETFHDLMQHMRERTRDDLRMNLTPLLDRVDHFQHDHVMTDDDWTLLVRLRFDRDYETHARLRGYSRLSEFVRDLHAGYRTRMLSRARGAIPAVWRDRLRSIAD